MMKTKKLLMLLAISTFFVGGLHAQTSIIVSPEVGIHSSKSKMTGDFDISQNFQGMDVNYSGIFAYQGGVAIGFQFSNWAILTGVKYNRKGGKVTVESRDPNNQFLIPLSADSMVTDVGELSITSKHNWLSIPILARGQFGGAFKVGIAVGPQINMAIGKYKETTEYNFENVNLNNVENNFEYGKSTSHPIKKSHISLLILPYITYEMNENSGIKLSMMIESGANMVNDHFVVGNENFVRNVQATERNTQIGIMLSYEHRFNLKTGVKY